MTGEASIETGNLIEKFHDGVILPVSQKLDLSFCAPLGTLKFLHSCIITIKLHRLKCRPQQRI
jgi:hypothetical protein